MRPVAPTVHPWAWWGWALCVAGAVSLTTNPLLLSLLTLAVTGVVVLRRTDDPWARSVGVYFALAGIILAMRLVFQVFLGIPRGTTVLFVLPQVELPAWVAGIRIGGPVTAEALLGTLYDTLRLAVMLLCLGAANSLANPRRALRVVPAALYEASVAVVIALSVAPQLIESAQRVRRAQRLRGGAGRGWRAVTAVVIPVLADAIDRSLALAAGMEARGFGRTRGRAPAGRWATAALVGSMLLLTFGGYLVLSGSHPVVWAVACLIIGGVGVVAGLRTAGRALAVTRYRPDVWGRRDSRLVGAGAVALASALVVGLLDPGALTPATVPLAWPPFHPAMLAVVAGAAAPLALTADPLAAAPSRKVALA